MQDSLGGNAKTLMFVNFSPADYNADETVMLRVLWLCCIMDVTEYYLWLVQYIVMLYFRTLNLFSCDDCTAYHYCIHKYVVLVSARVFMIYFCSNTHCAFPSADNVLDVRRACQEDREQCI